MGEVKDSMDRNGAAGETRKNLRFEVATELYRAIPEIEEDVTARPDGHSSVDFITALAASPTPEEAITYCAYVLPRRFSVWWGHECLKKIDDTLGEIDRQMLELAAAWVGALDEDSRYRALDAAMATKSKTPGVWVALAAGWSSGSMVGPDLPPVPPPPYLTARAVNAGILSALARIDYEHRDEHLQRFVRMALLLAQER